MRTIDEPNLLPGDVLLSLGDGALSDGIMKLDGGSYSHAALWSGHETVEATLPAVQRVPLSQSRSRARYIDVFRHADAIRTREEIATQAIAHIGAPYAEADLMIATLVLTVSAWMPDDWSELHVLFGLGTLRRWLDTLRGMNRERGDRFTCVALAVHAHIAASFSINVRLSGDRQFDIQVMVRAFRALVELRSRQRARGMAERSAFASSARRPEGEWLDEGEEAELLEELERCMRSDEALLAARVLAAEAVTSDQTDLNVLRQQWHREFGAPPCDILEAAPAGLGSRDLRAGTDWPISLVTPRQLQASASMVSVGRIWLRPGA